ncbi:MAG: chromosome segregation protein SMC [Burkholderiaceae bacterium]
MRLKQLKLAGFKSFVDPTAFEVPSQLVGVVGPNGCGKSNVMDAVRWVLGESKASELRGESMQDVIFNGSSERKPASRASVELVFDNSLGRIGGHWAAYAEISVKRVLTRDGQSTYLINNQVVRRRDVHDMFLGTGLGPRAYAIIGQGMISRIIEARPEDLRVFLEEAAGVSKYKERRRETENRLHDTRENLTRVEDIQRELGTQIERLARQAEVARQFRELEDERLRKQRMLWIVRRDEALAEQRRITEAGRALVVSIDERLAEQRAAEAEIERLRTEHYEAGDAVHAAQGRYFEANSEVSRLESEIRYVVDAQREARQRADALAGACQAARDEEQRALQQTEADRERLAGLEIDAEADAERLAVLSEQAPAAEESLRTLRDELDAARAEALQTRQAIELSATRRRAAEQRLHELARRRERLEDELSRIGAPDAESLDAMARSLEAAELAEAASAEALARADAAWHEIDARRLPAQQALREAEARLAQIDARMAALRQVQERVQSQGKIAPWLARHGLDQLGRLWHKLRIEHGWETAIESALRENVSALQVERLDHLAGLVADAPPARVSFFAATASAGPADVGASAPPPGLAPLMSRVHCADAGVQAMLADWLHGLYAADSVEAAVAARDRLAPGARCITAGGHIVDRFSIRIYAPDSEQDGVLARQFELDNLEREQRAQRLLADQARDEAVRIEAAAGQRRTALGEARDTHHLAVRQLSAARVDHERLDAARQRAAMTVERLQAELAEVLEGEEGGNLAVDAETEAFERLDLELADRQQRVETLAERFEAGERELATRRDASRQAERDAQERSFAIRELRAQLGRLAEQAAQARERFEQSSIEREQLEDKLLKLSDEAAREGLQQALDVRAQAEQALSAARQRLDELSQALRSREERRMTIERDQEPLRQKLVDLQLKEQAARINAEQFAQQLGEGEVDEEAVRAAFDEAPKASWLQGEVTRLGNAIAALGPVNLAALDELNEANERKGFLDAQSADLTEAIETLEDAIRKIDRESREVLQSTYDTVNREFGRLFPELFGGGEARLMLTGDEILDAGVQVMAHPPGKRNSTIHLLSGGEKALTAIALVFAMFQLNPAPFCLLDEVDAPLDDANTERYCDMVRRMSDQTQFLFITHNKIAMELAQQLVGVTMQERGVSRIVAVDLEAATQLAQAA